MVTIKNIDRYWQIVLKRIWMGFLMFRDIHIEKQVLRQGCICGTEVFVKDSAQVAIAPSLHVVVAANGKLPCVYFRRCFHVSVQLISTQDILRYACVRLLASGKWRWKSWNWFRRHGFGVPGHFNFFSFRMSPVNEELLGTCMECFAGLHVLRQSLTSSDVLLMWTFAIARDAGSWVSTWSTFCPRQDVKHEMFHGSSWILVECFENLRFVC